MENIWISQESIEKVIPEIYGIKVYACEPIKKIYKLITDDGIKVLKKVNASYERYLFTVEAMNHARNHGFLNIPPIMTTRDGKAGVDTPTGILMISDWVSSREADYTSYSDLELTTMALADFHQVSIGFEPSAKTDPRVLWGKWIENFQTRAKEMLLFREQAQGKEEKSEFDRKILHYTDYFYDWAMKSIHHLEKSCYRKLAEESKKNRTFCHHDMAYHNVLFTKDNEAYLIDFDYCIMDMTIHDLTSLILRTIRYGSWDLERAYWIFNTYNRGKPILGEEIGVMKAFMEFPQEFWQIGLQYYVEQQPWEEEVFHRRLDRILLDIPIREVFMRKFLV